MNDLIMVKKKYIKPITESFPMIEEDFVASTPENHNSQLDDEQGVWVNVNPDSIEGDDIDW